MGVVIYQLQVNLLSTSPQFSTYWKINNGLQRPIQTSWDHCNWPKYWNCHNIINETHYHRLEKVSSILEAWQFSSWVFISDAAKCMTGVTIPPIVRCIWSTLYHTTGSVSTGDLSVVSTTPNYLLLTKLLSKTSHQPYSSNRAWLWRNLCSKAVRVRSNALTVPQKVSLPASQGSLHFINLEVPAEYTHAVKTVHEISFAVCDRIHYKQWLDFILYILGIKVV